MTIIIQAKRKFLAPPLVRTIDDPRDPLNLGLVGHWTMDAETVNATRMLDLSGKDNHGALIGSPLIRPGRVREALRLDGSTQYVDVGNSTALSPPSITALCWIRPTTFTGVPAYTAIVQRTEAANQNYYQFLLKSSGKLATYLLKSGSGPSFDGTGANTLVAGVWYHLAFVYNAGVAITAYVNGSTDIVNTIGAAAMGALPIISASTLLFGGNPNLFNGDVDDVRIYNRALTPAEISRLYWNPARDRVPYQTRGRLKAGTGSTTITGALAVTEANDTIAAVGRVAVGGTLAVPEQADTINAAGAVGVAGALAKTEQADTLAAAGTVTALGAITGTLSAFQAAQTLIATGQILVSGALNVTQAAQTLSATGTVAAIPPPGQRVQILVMA